MRVALAALLALAACATASPAVKNDPASYRSVCETGTPEFAAAACFELAGQYARGEGVEPDDVESVRLLEKACLGRGPAVPHACRALGRAFLEGRGVETDWKAAERWLVTACELGEGLACLDAGVLADDAGANPGLALERYEKACEADVAEGCLLFGSALASGRGALVDDAAARRALDRACRLGSAEACSVLP